jgi:hypothetical protein
VSLVRVAVQDLERVVELAVLTEETTSEEQKSLIQVAHRVDAELNKQSSFNPHADRTYEKPSRLAREAGCSKADCRICTKVPCRCGVDFIYPECRNPKCVAKRAAGAA